MQVIIGLTVQDKVQWRALAEGIISVWLRLLPLIVSGVPKNFVWGGVQQIQVSTEDRENGDLGAVALQSGVLETAVIWYKKFHFI